MRKQVAEDQAKSRGKLASVILNAPDSCPTQESCDAGAQKESGIRASTLDHGDLTKSQKSMGSQKPRP